MALRAPRVRPELPARVAQERPGRQVTPPVLAVPAELTAQQAPGAMAASAAAAPQAATAAPVALAGLRVLLV
jgi:hypothetical protein